MTNVQIPEKTFFQIYFLLQTMDASVLDDYEQGTLSEIMPILDAKFEAIKKRAAYAVNLSRRDTIME